MAKVYKLIDGSSYDRDTDGRRTRKTTYIVDGVASESAVWGATDIDTALRVPIPGERSGGYIVQPSNARPRGGSQWEVVIDEIQPSAVELGSDTTGDVDQIPYEFEWEIASEIEERAADIDGNMIVNSAGEPYDATFSFSQNRLFLTLTYPSSGFNPGLAYELQNKINSEACFVLNTYALAAGQIRVVSIRPMQRMQTIDEVVRVEAKLELRPGTNPFQLRVPDRGFRARTAATTDLQRLFLAPAVTSSPAIEVSDAVFLNGSGQPANTNYKCGVVIDPNGAYPTGSQLTAAATVGTAVFGTATVKPFTVEAAGAGSNLVYKRYASLDLRGRLPGIR